MTYATFVRLCNMFGPDEAVSLALAVGTRADVAALFLMLRSPRKLGDR